MPKTNIRKKTDKVVRVRVNKRNQRLLAELQAKLELNQQSVFALALYRLAQLEGLEIESEEAEGGDSL